MAKKAAEGKFLGYSATARPETTSPERDPAQGAGAHAAAARRRPFVIAQHRGFEPAAAGLDRVLGARAGGAVVEELDRYVRRRMACLPPVEAAQASGHVSAPLVRTRSGRQAGVEVLGQRARRLVERRGLAHEPALAMSYFTQLGWSCCSLPSGASSVLHEPYTGPHAPWCERAARVASRPTRTSQAPLSA